MPSTIRLWQINGAELLSIDEARFAEHHTEKHLEEWVAQNPSLLGSDLRIIGRQVHLHGAGLLDLAALSPDGRICVIEFKRQQSDRDTIAQVLHYSAAIKRFDAEELVARFQLNADEAEEIAGSDPTMIIVAADSVYEVDRIAHFLSGKNILIEVITFSYARMADGTEVIARTIVVPEGETSGRTGMTKRTPRAPGLEQILQIAEKRRVREMVEILRRVNNSPLDWPEYRYQSNGGALRYVIAAPPDRRARVIFGMNVGGKK